MKKAYSIFLLLILLGCQSRPKNFTHYYEDINTGLEKRINIEGYYVSEHGCDSLFYSMFMFYSDGLFTIATTSDISSDLINCFENGGHSSVCKYPTWGIYTLEGDLIKTQTIRTEGSAFVIFRDYQILPKGDIINISDYSEYQYTNLAYLKNYPSFTDNPCKKTAKFYPLKSKRDISDCPLLKKKWFRAK